MSTQDRIEQLQQESRQYRAEARLWKRAAELLPLIAAQATAPVKMSFNTFVALAAHKGIGINEDREAFHAFVSGGYGTTLLALAEWWKAWGYFCRLPDAIDLANTQNDTRYAGAW